MSEKDGEGRRVRLVTLCRANFGTALENFSLAAFRGKLGEFSTWPIVLHYGDDKVHSPRARKIEIYVYFQMKYVAKLCSVKINYVTLYILIHSDKFHCSFSILQLQITISSRNILVLFSEAHTYLIID